MKTGKKILLALLASAAIGSSVFALDICYIAGCPGFSMYKTQIHNQSVHNLDLMSTNWYSVHSMYPQINSGDFLELDHDANMISSVAWEMDPNGNSCSSPGNVMPETVNWGCPAPDAPFAIDYDMNFQEAGNPGVYHLCHVHVEMCLDKCDINTTANAGNGWPGYVSISISDIAAP